MNETDAGTVLFQSKAAPATRFRAERGRTCLAELLGMPTRVQSDDGAPARARGHALVETSLGRIEADGWKLTEQRATEAELELAYTAAALAFFKEWRRFISGSIAHLLTAPQPFDDTSGWTAIELQHPGNPAVLLACYRLNDPDSTRSFPLRALSPETRYVVRTAQEANVGVFTGAALMEKGLPVNLPSPNTASILVLSPESQRP